MMNYVCLISYIPDDAKAQEELEKLWRDFDLNSNEAFAWDTFELKDEYPALAKYIEREVDHDYDVVLNVDW